VFDGILSAADNEHIIDSLVVYDSLGGKHTVKATFRKDDAPPPQGASVNWKITLFEGEQEVGRGNLPFWGAQVAPGSSPLPITLTLAGAQALEVQCNFATVSGVDIGASSSLRVSNQDGRAPGTIVSESFDKEGILKIIYSNGQKADGGRLVLAQIRDEAGLVAQGKAVFSYEGQEMVSLRVASDDLSVRSGALEPSNVDLTQQFSELILMQRGYQASSQVLSTANDMLQELLQLKGSR
jgi:flagellar hook protein FlgE